MKSVKMNKWILFAFQLLCLCLGRCSGQSTHYFHLPSNSTRPKEGQIRLVGGSTHYEGNVEIYHFNRWGSICDDEWDKMEAEIACRLLGFRNANAIPTGNSRFGKAKKLIWMDNLYCSGNETALNQCRFDGWKIHDCTSQEAAGVICRPRSSRNRVRLPNKEKIENLRRMIQNITRIISAKSTLPKLFNPVMISEVRITGGKRVGEGQVQVRLQSSSSWNFLCSDGWSLTEAMVTCRQLGLGYGQFASAQSIASLEQNSVLPSVQCKGYESGLNRCSIRFNDGRQSCSGNGNHNVAYVVCSRDLPDLIPDAKEIENSAFLEDRPIYLLQCALEENCLSSGAYNHDRNDLGFLFDKRRLLRFTAKIGNFGTADFRPFLPKLNWEWHSCHRHYHSMEVFAHFDIIDSKGKRVAEGHKASFCLEDNNCLAGVGPKYSCKNFGDQGISVGCIDTYMSNIDCQWIDITDIPPGLYTLKISINPEFKVSEISFDNNAAVCFLYYNAVSARVWNCTLTRP